MLILKLNNSTSNLLALADTPTSFIENSKRTNMKKGENGHIKEAINNKNIIKNHPEEQGPCTMLLTKEELIVLSSLNKRHEEIRQESHILEQKQKIIAVMEDKLEKKTKELESLRDAINGLLGQYNTQEKNNFRALAKIYEKMKPKEAARILSSIDLNIVINVFGHMREMSSSQILSHMDTDQAKAITMALTKDQTLDKKNRESNEDDENKEDAATTD